MKLFQTRKPFSASIALALLAVFTYSTANTAVALAPKAPAPRSAGQNDKLDFSIKNETGYKIKEVMIAKSVDPVWGPDDDVMQGDAFENDSTIAITFSPHEHAEHWDIKVVYAIDGSSHEWDDLNLTGITKVTLTYDAAANSTHAEVE